jgi:hypothetical protein
VYADHVANEPWSMFHHDVAVPLPYQPLLGGAATRIDVDTSGGKRASVHWFGDFALEARAVSASVAEFEFGPDWALLERSHANPVSQNTAPSFLMHEVGGQGSYQVDLKFTIDPDLREVVIDELDVWYCDRWSECPGFAGLPPPGP